MTDYQDIPPTQPDSGSSLDAALRSLLIALRWDEFPSREMQDRLTLWVSENTLTQKVADRIYRQGHKAGKRFAMRAVRTPGRLGG